MLIVWHPPLERYRGGGEPLGAGPPGSRRFWRATQLSRHGPGADHPLKSSGAIPRDCGGPDLWWPSLAPARSHGGRPDWPRRCASCTGRQRARTTDPLIGRAAMTRVSASAAAESREPAQST